ncbi:MAG: ABC transporter ATP-binding protein [bacterium]
MTAALELERLCKTYPNGVNALNGIDLEVASGDFFALLGPNGAGKSTAIGIVSSLVNKSSGQVRVFGQSIDENPVAVKRQIGLVPQEFNFNQFEPVVEIVVNQAGFYGIPRSEAYQRAGEVLKQLDLWDKRDAEARSLSGGMKRRLMIARALAHRPRLLILDEPTAGVDIEIRNLMWAFLKDINQQGTTVILTTHYLEEAESLCRNIAIINHGEIAEHAAMGELLQRLHRQTFVLNITEEIPETLSDGQFELCRVDAHTLEASVAQDQELNALFSHLSDLGLKVLSMRNKQNRLEQLFLDMVANGRSGS